MYIKMIITFLFFVYSSVYAGDFRKLDWGMTTSKVKALLEDDTSYTFHEYEVVEFDTSYTKLRYFTSIHDLDALVKIEFTMYKDTLFMGNLKFYQKMEYDGFYVKSMITDKYGEGKRVDKRDVYSCQWKTSNTNIKMYSDHSEIIIDYISTLPDGYYSNYLASYELNKIRARRKEEERIKKNIDEDF